MNIMSSEKRKYTLKARARQQATTRRRIVDATSALHQQVGPANTTVAEIARRAGVQRPTVYKHFPDDRSLFAACGASWTAANPTPDPSPAMAISDPTERVRAVLQPLYEWFRKNRRMVFNIERDRLVLPTLDEVVRSGRDEQLSRLADALAAGFETTAVPPRLTRAAVTLALDFWTWHRLADQGATDREAADLMAGAVRAAAGH